MTVDVAPRPDHVSRYGVDPSASNNGPALAAAFASAAAAGSELDLGYGTLRVSSYPTIKSNLRAFGHGADTVIKAAPGLTVGLLVGTSAEAVTGVRLRDVVLDGDYSASALSVNGVQATNATDAILERVTFRDFGRQGSLFQGVGGRVRLLGCEWYDTGRDGSTAGHAASFSGITDWQVDAPHIRGSRGMGISGVSSPDGKVFGGSIETVAHPAHTGYEAIGLAPSCPRAHVVGTVAVATQDNGFSLSGADSSIAGVQVNTCVNHGIYLGPRGLVSGASIRNVGTAYLVDGLAYAGVALAGSDSVVTGISAIDTQSTPTMGYGIKEAPGCDNNIITGNQTKGYRIASVLRVGANTTITR